MDGFEDVKLSWKDDSYTVPADRVFDLVRRIEKTIMDGGSTPAFVLLMNQRVPYSTLSMAYAEALQYAGAEISASEVMFSIMNDFASDSAKAAEKVQTAVIGLLMIISPPIAAEIMGNSEKK